MTLPLTEFPGLLLVISLSSSDMQEDYSNTPEMEYRDDQHAIIAMEEEDREKNLCISVRKEIVERATGDIPSTVNVLKIKKFERECNGCFIRPNHSWSNSAVDREYKTLEVRTSLSTLSSSKDHSRDIVFDRLYRDAMAKRQRYKDSRTAFKLNVSTSHDKSVSLCQSKLKQNRANVHITTPTSNRCGKMKKASGDAVFHRLYHQGQRKMNKPREIVREKSPIVSRDKKGPTIVSNEAVFHRLYRQAQDRMVFIRREPNEITLHKSHVKDSIVPDTSVFIRLYQQGQTKFKKLENKKEAMLNNRLYDLKYVKANSKDSQSTISSDSVSSNDSDVFNRLHKQSLTKQLMGMENRKKALAKRQPIGVTNRTISSNYDDDMLSTRLSNCWSKTTQCTDSDDSEVFSRLYNLSRSRQVMGREKRRNVAMSKRRTSRPTKTISSEYAAALSNRLYNRGRLSNLNIGSY